VVAQIRSGQREGRSGSAPRGRRWLGLGLTAVLAAPLLAACGADEEGPPNITWYIGQEAWMDDLAENCTEEAGGRYTVGVAALPTNPDQQREQLVRRLAAEDTDIDIIGMDVIWTAEFAEAGWLLPYEGEVRADIEANALEGPLASGTYQDELWAAPLTSNTQLLWYRESRVAEPPETWEEMIQMGEALGPEGRVQITGARAESLMVTVNALLASVGGAFLEDADAGTDANVSLELEPTAEVLRVLRDFATSPVADPALSNVDEDTARLNFQTGDSTFMINYPFVYPSALEADPDLAADYGAARFPAVNPGEPSRPPLGGYNLGVSRFSENPEFAVEAVQCLRTADNQEFAAIEGGQPPTDPTVYDRPDFQEEYPFGEILRESINDAEPRPVTPAYNDLSLAVQRTLHPLDANDPEEAARTLRDLIARALDSQAVL
jgi:multiple sugar transport system substrate-binding protein